MRVSPLTLLLSLCVARTASAQIRWDEHPENRWVLQSPRPGAAVPRFGWEGSGGYDPVGRRWIHHAGHDGNPQGFVLFTWDLKTGAWEQRFPPTSPPGVCCVDGSNVFDVAARRLVRFPGGSLGHGYQWSRGVRLKDSAVWLYDPEANAWTNMRPPPYKEGAAYSKEVVGGLCSAATYAESLELSLSFGGSGAGGAKNNLHAYDAYANALTAIKAESPPEARDGCGLAYDPVREKLILFGSQYLSDERTWVFDFRRNAWEPHALEPRPPGKKAGTYSTIPKMAYDSRNGIHLAVAWRGEKDGHETWAFETEKLQWTKLAPSAEAEPSKSRSRNLAYSPEHNVFILETTAVSGGPQVWTYRYRNAPPSPAAPEGLQVVTEPGGARLSWKGDPTREFEIHRAEGAEPWRLQFARIGTVRGTTFADGGLTAGKTYFYKIKGDRFGGTARTQPRVALKPVVSVRTADRVEVHWNAHPDSDVTGYNVYRGVAAVKTVTKGTPAAWKDNDPEYAQPQVVKVTDVVRLEKLNGAPIAGTAYEDKVDLSAREAEAGDYGRAVHAYVIRAVNRLGTESGPSPYALTIPSEPVQVLCREKGTAAELKWDAGPEKGLQGYHVYKLEGGVFGIRRVTEKPVAVPGFTHEAGKGPTRYWVVAVDALGQEGQPSSPAWFGQTYKGFFSGDWHQ